jgi:hypothetical protein
MTGPKQTALFSGPPAMPDLIITGIAHRYQIWRMSVRIS